MKILTYILIPILTVSLILGTVSIAQADNTISGNPITSWWSRTSDTLYLLDTALELGSNAVRIAKGYFDALDVTTLVIGGIVSGDLTVEGGIYVSSTLPLISTGISGTQLNIIPMDSFTIIGDAASTTHSLSTNDDLLVSGELEVDGMIYGDDSITLKTNVIFTGDGNVVTTANGDIGLIPNGSGITIVGDANSTSHSLNLNDDLYVSGRLEVDGYFYNDASSTAGIMSLFKSSPSVSSSSTVLTLEADGANWETGGRVLKIISDDSQALPFAINNGSGDVFYVQRTGALFMAGDLSLTAGANIISTSDGDIVITPNGDGAVILGKTGGTGYNRTGWGATSHTLASSSDLFVDGILEVDGISYFDGAISIESSATYLDDKESRFGTGSDFRMLWNTSQTNDSFMLGTDAISRTILLAEYTDALFDFAHGAQTNPTLFIHSASQTTDMWISFTHDQTDGIIDVGTGGIRFNDATIFNSGGRFLNDVNLNFGSSSKAALQYDTAQTANSLMLAVGDESNSLVMVEKADLISTFDFAHGLQTNPTLFIHSANTSTDEWLSLTHDQTDAVINSGKGALTIENGVFRFKETSGSPTARTGYGALFTSATNELFFQDGDGETHTVRLEETLIGEMYAASNTSAMTINTVEVWEEINDFSTGKLNGFTFGGSGDLTVGENSSGTYLLNYTVSAKSAATNKIFEYAISVNNVIQLKCRSARKYAVTDVGNNGGICILDLIPSDVIKLETRNITDANNITIQDSNVSLHGI